MTRVHILISGKVQGVFFRAYTQSQAQKLGLAGWVRNLPDGRVEAVFEGEKDKVEEMIAWCWRGSPSARVEDVEIRDIKEVKDSGEFRGFEVRR